MLLNNPYKHTIIDYPLDLSPNNIVLEYHIEHETFFCPWFSAWIVATLSSGEVLYIPTGERNRRDIYVVTPFYLRHEVSFEQGVLTLRYSEFMQQSKLNVPNIKYSREYDDYVQPEPSPQYDEDDDWYNNESNPDYWDDDFDDTEIINNIVGN